jgi:hypothetical protein
VKVSIVEGQQRLAILWGTGSFVGLLILVAETYGKVWGSLAPEAFGWFLPMVVPTLTLIVGSVVAEQTKDTPSTSKVTPLAFWVTFWVSAVYLSFVALAVISAAWDDKPISVLKTSSLWLSPLQALVGGCIGVFFGRRTPSAAPKDISEMQQAASKNQG